MTNPNPVMALANMFSAMVGQDPPETSSATAEEHEDDLLTSRYGADAHMARSRITGAIELNGELVELRRGVTALWVGHAIVREHPTLFFIPALPEPDPEAEVPAVFCWTDGERRYPHETLGHDHDARYRRWRYG